MVSRPARFGACATICTSLVRTDVLTAATPSMLSPGQRIRVGDDTATIRFAGNIPPWPNTLAYGIEWDNPKRGKNSGTLDGILYFQTEIEGAGSFIKASNRNIHAPVTFMSALMKRYAGEDNVHALEKSIAFGLKVVENYGFEKLNTIQRNVFLLKEVMLDKQDIGMCTDLPMFPLTELLDLSYNLLHDWTHVEHILHLFLGLQSLNLNGNRFVGLPQLSTGTKLHTLLLADAGITRQQLQLLVLPNIRTMCLASNNLTSEDCEQMNISKLSKLDLSFNNLDSIPLLISTCSVSSLAVAYNNIQLTSDNTFPSVTTLDIRNNNINHWDEIDHISKMFPSLEDLRIEGCPLFENLSVDVITINLIARLECSGSHLSTYKIKRLNGSLLLSKEIQNAELYFISKVRQGQIVYANKSRWENLLKKNGLSNTRIIHQSEMSDKVLLHVSILNDSIEPLTSRVFLKSNSVLRLKGVISRYLDRPIFDFVVFIPGDDSDPYGVTTVRYLEDDATTLQSLGLQDDQKIFISWKGH